MILKIAILDDYQNAVKALPCFSLLNEHEVFVFTDRATSLEAQIQRLYDMDAVVLIRERTPITEALLAQLPNLKLISQTGKVSQHIDILACQKHGVAITEGVGTAIAPAE